MLADAYGRMATDLRVSLTDRCNLRCSYCMPPEGLDWLPKPELLTDDELVRLTGVAVELLGGTEVRFTRGEPPARRRRARAAAPARPGPAQRIPGHAAPGAVPDPGPAGPARRRAGRPVRGRGDR